MSTEPITVSSATGTGTTAAEATVPAKRKFQFDQRYIAPLFITCILIGAHLSIGALEAPEKTGLAILTAILAEIVLGRLYTGKTPHLASAYISGISVGILVRSPMIWPYVMCALISIMSKYVLRLDGRHLWNPSNFGIAAMLFLAPTTVASLSVQFGNSIGPMIVIWILGSVIVSRLKRFHICATFVASFFFFAWVRSLILHSPFGAEVAPITGPMYQLFTFFMITDPKTTVSGKKAQILVAFLVAMAESIFRLNQQVHAPYYALFFVGPAANLVEILMNRRNKARKAASVPANAPA